MNSFDSALVCVPVLVHTCVASFLYIRVYMHVPHALDVGSRSFHVFTSVDLSSGQNITRIHNGLVGPSTKLIKNTTNKISLSILQFNVKIPIIPIIYNSSSLLNPLL